MFRCALLFPLAISRLYSGITSSPSSCHRVIHHRGFCFALWTLSDDNAVVRYNILVSSKVPLGLPTTACDESAAV
jgi:hypothetical protein